MEVDEDENINRIFEKLDRKVDYIGGGKEREIILEE